VEREGDKTQQKIVKKERDGEECKRVAYPLEKECGKTLGREIWGWMKRGQQVWSPQGEDDQVP